MDHSLRAGILILLGLTLSCASSPLVVADRGESAERLAILADPEAPPIARRHALFTLAADCSPAWMAEVRRITDSTSEPLLMRESAVMAAGYCAGDTAGPVKFLRELVLAGEAHPRLRLQAINAAHRLDHDGLADAIRTLVNDDNPILAAAALSALGATPGG